MKRRSTLILRIISAFIFLFLIASHSLPVSMAQDASKEKKPARENKTQEGKKESEKPAQSTPAEKDKEEYYEVKTPFGVQRYPKKPGVTPFQQPIQASPVTATGQTPAAQSPAGGNPQSPVSSDPKISKPPATDAKGAKPDQPNPLSPAPADAQNPSEKTSTPVKTNPQKAPVPETAAGTSSVRLQFVNADLSQIINIICTELKLNYIVDPKVKGIVNINTAGDVKREDLMPILETLLKINGATIIKTGSFFRIIPVADVKQSPMPIRSQNQAEGLTGQDEMVIQVLPMQYVSAADMAKVLSPFLSEGGNMVVHERANILIITETSSNLKKLFELVNIFDTDVFQSKRVQLFPIKNNRSHNLLADLESVFGAYSLSSSKESAIRFISIDSINSILAVSSNPNSFAEIEKWIDKLDRPLQTAGTRNYVYKIQNGSAKEIGSTLMAIYGKRKEKELPSLASTMTAAQTPPSFPTASVSTTEKDAGYLQGDIKIVADEINNALIVQCTPPDYETIKETIKSLDIVPRQVLIDAKIYEVNLTGALSMGVSAFLQERKNQVRNTEASFSASRSATVQAGLNISTFTPIGATRELIGFLNAQESRTHARILSSPSVVASDNITARIQVGTEVPTLSSQGVVPGGQVGGTSLFSNTIQNRSTGIIMSVTPRINASGWVTLKINQEVSSPIPPDAGNSGIQSPSISIRSVETQITVKDGETIAIGGIISENKLYSRNRVPLLGNIPGLGLLFGNTSQTNTRTELIALITPHVIQDIETAADITEELKSQLKNIKKDLKKIGWVSN